MLLFPIHRSFCSPFSMVQLCSCCMRTTQIPCFSKELNMAKWELLYSGLLQCQTGMRASKARSGQPLACRLEMCSHLCSMIYLFVQPRMHSCLAFFYIISCVLNSPFPKSIPRKLWTKISNLQLLLENSWPKSEILLFSKVGSPLNIITFH